MSAITAEMQRDFAADGALVLRGVFTDWVERLREGVAEAMARPSRLERSYQPAGSARFFQDLCRWQDVAEFRAFVEQSGAGALAGALMGADGVRFFHDHILVKEVGAAVVTPWHQDRPYYCVDAERSVSFWIPLDPVAREFSLRCVAGSHRSGTTHRPMRFDGSALYAGDERPDVPDIDADPAAYRILAWDMAPGDAVAFDFGTVHGAAGTVGAAARRRVFSARFVADGARFADRGGRGSPPFDHLTLQDGDRLDGAEFPVVWRKEGLLF